MEEKEKQGNLLLDREAMRMVSKIFGRLHPAELVILRNRLAGKVRPVAAEDEALAAAIDYLEEAREGRRKAYEALPKCVKCGGVGQLGYHVDKGGEIKPYHLQCAGEKMLTNYDRAKMIEEAQKKMSARASEEFIKSTKDADDIIRVQDELKAKDKEAVRKIAEAKDGRKMERAVKTAVQKNSKRHIRKDEPLANIATIAAAKEKK